MFEIFYTTQFKKDFKRAKKQGKDISKLISILSILQKQEQLPELHRDHNLTGNYLGFRECHITPDWLLIYKVEEDKLILTLVRTGLHSELF